MAGAAGGGGDAGAGYSFWGEHRNDLTPENFAAMAARMRQVAGEHGLAIAGIASNAAAPDLEQVKLLVEGAATCGAPFIRVGAPRGYDRTINYHELYAETVEAYGRAVEAAAGSGVKLVLETHGGTIHVSTSLAYRILSNFTPTQVGVIYDPQNMVMDGYETTELGLEILGEYVAHAHVGGHRPGWRRAGERGRHTGVGMAGVSDGGRGVRLSADAGEVEGDGVSAFHFDRGFSCAAGGGEVGGGDWVFEGGRGELRVEAATRPYPQIFGTSVPERTNSRKRGDRHARIGGWIEEGW